MVKLATKFFNYMKKAKSGFAGIDLLISVMAGLFMAGVLAMLFVISSAELQDATTDTTAITTINDTGTALADVVDWFPILIVVTAIVVIVLLIALLMRAIKSSGVMGGA